MTMKQSQVGIDFEQLDEHVFMVGVKTGLKSVAVNRVHEWIVDDEAGLGLELANSYVTFNHSLTEKHVKSYFFHIEQVPELVSVRPFYPEAV
ncbi:hypothetical protein [Marinobacterium jannaschii]|uniref:hypothetical protein n=1 Tax=Marinobacterium jannaschii TaxID=64970 RepID=UPI00048221AE|nr:hypothetical protein [Marinobacterium jannaschii]